MAALTDLLQQFVDFSFLESDPRWVSERSTGRRWHTRNALNKLILNERSHRATCPLGELLGVSGSATVALVSQLGQLT